MLFNYEDEIRDGYLVKEKYKHIWAIEMDILREISRVCEKHNLSYFVYGGTLLGAIRHKGFIPWDDDMDIAMLREDYEEFLKVVEKEFDIKVYCLQRGEEFGEIYEGFSRIRYNNSTAIIKRDSEKDCNHGIFIDIFPLDRLPKKKWQRKVQFPLIKIISGLVYYRTYDDEGMSHKHIRNIAKRIKCEKIWKWLANILKHICMMYNTNGSSVVGILSCDPYDEKCYWHMEDIKETIELPYENMIVKAPVGYDRCLKIGYGDYMKFPPENERGNWHQHIFYDPYKPYTEYVNRKKLFD